MNSFFLDMRPRSKNGILKKIQLEVFLGKDIQQFTLRLRPKKKENYIRKKYDCAGAMEIEKQRQLIQQYMRKHDVPFDEEGEERYKEEDAEGMHQFLASNPERFADEKITYLVCRELFKELLLTKLERQQRRLLRAIADVYHGSCHGKEGKRSLVR